MLARLAAGAACASAALVLAPSALSACAPAARDGDPRAASQHASSSPARPRLATKTELPARPALTRRATFRYEINGHPFPLPIVKGSIAGVPTSMLVDTGANSHVIAGWFARRLRLPMKKLGDVGTDHVGKTIATYRIEKPAITLEGWGRLDVPTALAAEVPDAIERLGIGAFISPQRLTEEGDAVVLDLAAAELRSAWWDEAHYELSEVGEPLVLGHSGRVCEENEGPIRGLAFVLPARIENHPAELLVDTGAQHSDLLTSSAAGQRLAAQSVTSKEPMYTASGRISGRKLRGARVSVGSVATVTDVDLIPGSSDTSCPRDGVLAMDVLRKCALLLGRDRIYGRCVSAPR